MAEAAPVRLERLATGAGTLLLAGRGDVLLAAEFDPARLDRTLARRGLAAVVREAPPSHPCRRLAAWFAGDLAALDAVAIDVAGTLFQRQVWTALRGLPAGTTSSYGALARRLGRPAAARAVGAANGANPVAVVVPCHRLVGAGGGLTGYAGGLAAKRWLLDHECRHAGG